jgi:twinkle protein
MHDADSNDSLVLARERCPTCASRGFDFNGDNLARYADGHGHCFACGRHEGASGEKTSKTGGTGKIKDKQFNPLSIEEYARLGKRRISEETCRKFGYGLGRFKDGTLVQVEPYYNAAGELVAQHTRDAAKNFKWLGNPREALLFGQQLWGAGGRRVILTEGAIDCLSVSQIQGNKWPVASIKSGAQGAAGDVKNALEWLESYEEVVFCFDMDEAGRQAARKCAALLSPGKARIAHLPLKDANECLTGGKIEELTRALWNAKPYRPDGIVNIRDLKEKSRQAVPYGADFQYGRLCETIRGIRGGELLLFTAGSGIGQSTIVHEIGYELNQRHGWPLGVLALEESNGKTARRYVGIKLDKPLILPGCAVPDGEYDAAFDELAARGDIWFYDHFGSTDVDGILGKLRYLAVSCGVKAIILDHISIIVSGLDEIAESERKTIDKLMTRLRSLVEETGIAVLAVVHLKRPEKGKSWNEGREPSLTDLRGSGALEQLSDVVIALERDQQGNNSNQARLRVLKNRPAGLTGQAGLVEYNPVTGRLLAIEEEEECPFGAPDKTNDNNSDY